MADALISPAVGGVMLAASAGLTGFSIKKQSSDLASEKVPAMGVMGAFVFAAQMINFTIPGTGSSGHICGGLLLAAILGPYGGFLSVASILIIQALFFADGGLLALGCNIFNMGFFACYVAYPLIYKPITSKCSVRKIWIGSVLASVIGLQLGAFSVVLETLLSGRTELPFSTFALLMQPIHLAIGVTEGIITAAVLTFLYKSRPEILNVNAPPKMKSRSVLALILICAVLIGGGLSLAASSYPDGLEWSISKIGVQPEGDSSFHRAAAGAQETSSFLPDYTFGTDPDGENPVGTSLSGVVGSGLTLALCGFIAFICVFFKKKRRTA